MERSHFSGEMIGAGAGSAVRTMTGWATTASNEAAPHKHIA
jgi:hypothetical protein